MTDLTTDPTDTALRQIDPDSGLQQSYLILPDDRRKQRVLPVRRAYRHLRCGGVTNMSEELAETHAADPTFYSGTYCKTCRAHFPVGAQGEFVWVNCHIKDPEGDETLVGTVNLRPSPELVTSLTARRMPSMILPPRPDDQPSLRVATRDMFEPPTSPLVGRDMLMESPTGPYVARFAVLMEWQLARNRHKGDRPGWMKDTPDALLGRLYEEADELKRDIAAGATPDTIARSAADVANFCLFLADRCGGLGE
jgi:hypothetical protein